MKRFGMKTDRQKLTVSVIAERLNLSVKTVSTHKSNILQKMNMSTTAELIRYAINQRLVDNYQD